MKVIIIFLENNFLPIVYLFFSHFPTGQIGLSVLIESTDRKKLPYLCTILLQLALKESVREFLGYS